MPGAPENPVLGGVEYKHPQPPPGSGLPGGFGSFVQNEIDPPFIGSVAAVYAPSVPEVTAPFISSVSALYGPNLYYTGQQNRVSTVGTWQWLCPSDVFQVYVSGIGGGGGGPTSAGNSGGGGGGGGAFAARGAVPVTPGTLYTFVVGAGGALDQDGFSSTFTGDGGVQVIAVGGTKGGHPSGGAGGLASASTGDTGLQHDGGTGGDGANAAASGGGGGGASANNLATGNAGFPRSGTNGGGGGVGANGGGNGGTGGDYNTANAVQGGSPGGGGGGGGGFQNGNVGAGGEVYIQTGIVVPFIGSVTQLYAPTFPINPPFIASVTVVYTPSVPEVVVPFIASVTSVYAPQIANVLYPPFISSVTVVYTPTLPQVFAPFIASRTHVWTIFSLFNPAARFSGAGNGGEQYLVRLAPNGTSETATLTSSIGTETSGFLDVTGDSAWPSDHPFIVTIDSEQLYVSRIGPGNYRIRARGKGNTTVASHSAGASATWGDSYDVALIAAEDIAHQFTASINSTPSFTYPGWLICFDSSQAYLSDGTRYPMHVSEVVGVFDAGAGTSGSSRLDGPQPNAICTPTGASDDCPAALSNPARIATDIITGDVAVLRYTNPEAVVLDLGPRSASLQSWFGLMRVNATNVDQTFTDPDAYVVDTHPSGPGPGPFSGSVNGEWDPAPLVVGIAPDASDADPANAPIATPNTVPWTTVTLPGSDRFFTFGSGGGGYDRTGWPMCCLAVRQGDRRVPFWQSWDWHDFAYVYSGFGTDNNYAQLLINRNGVLFDSVPSVDLPGPQDIDGPDAVWDDGSYAFGASWYVVLFNGPYIVFGPIIGAGAGITPGEPGSSAPGVSFPGGAGGTPIISVPPINPIEGGSGGNIGGATGLHVWELSGGF